MNSNINKKGPDFKSSDEAFEFLLNQKLDEKRRKAWTEALGTTPEEKPKKDIKQTNLKRIYIRLGSIAAAAILIGGFFYFTQQEKPIDQYAGNLMQETEITISYGSESRGENNNGPEKEIASLRNELTTVLLDQDYNQALGYFKQLEKSTALNIEDKYYFAISLLKSKGEDRQKAIRLLNDVVAADNYNLENALWLRALAYGMTDNATLMKKDLNQLKSTSNKENKRVTDLLSRY